MPRKNKSETNEVPLRGSCNLIIRPVVVVAIGSKWMSTLLRTLYVWIVIICETASVNSDSLGWSSYEKWLTTKTKKKPVGKSWTNIGWTAVRPSVRRPSGRWWQQQRQQWFHDRSEVLFYVHQQFATTKCEKLSCSVGLLQLFFWARAVIEKTEGNIAIK